MKSDLIPEAEITLDLQALAVESMGWIPLSGKTYLHMGAKQTDEVVITLVGAAEDVQPGTNVLWVY